MGGWVQFATRYNGNVYAKVVQTCSTIYFYSRLRTNLVLRLQTFLTLRSSVSWTWALEQEYGQ